MNPITIAFHSSAAADVEEIHRVLAEAGLAYFDLVGDTTLPSDAPLGAQLVAQAGPALLLLNDGLLHGLQCQRDLLESYQELRRRDNFHVIVVHSERTRPNGETELVETPLTRVSDTMRYINYWQVVYLDARREHGATATDESSRALTPIRNVSQEIGETLRLIREDAPLAIEALLTDGGGTLLEILDAHPGTDAPGSTKPTEDHLVSESSGEDEPAVTELQSRDPMAAEERSVDLRPSAGLTLNGVHAEQLGRERTETDDIGAVVAPPELIPEPLSEPSPSTEVANPQLVEPGLPVDVQEVEFNPPVSDESSARSPAEVADEEVLPDPANEPGAEGLAELLLASAIDASAATAAIVATPQVAATEASPARTEVATPTPTEETAGAASEGEELSSVDAAIAAAVASDYVLFETYDALAIGADDSPSAESDPRTHSPDSPETGTHTRFLALLEAGHVHEAEALAREHLQADPQDHRLRYYLSVALAKLSEQKRSAALVEANEQLKLLYDTPFAAAAHLLLGTIRAEARDFGSARQHYKKAYRLDKEVDPELAYRIGSLVQDAFPERRREAGRFLRRATHESEEYAADAWYRLGQIHVGKTRWQKAIRAFKSARALDPEHPFAAYDLALLYLERGRLGKAARYFQRAIEANPELDSSKNQVAFAPSPVTPEVATPVVLGSSTNAERTTTLDRLTEDEIVNPRVRVLTVLITGASSGIGAATARAFAKRGHRLILTGRRIERLRALSSELSGHYRASVRLMSFDVTDPEAAEHMLATLPPDWNEIDVLINNAGKARGLEPIYQGNMQDWEEMIDTNVKGLLYMTRLVSPAMVERRRGHIINVCSTAGHEVYPNGAVYCATKHAVDAITKGTRLDLFKYNVRVSQVSPAAVEETEFSAVRFHGDEDKAAKVYEGFQPLRADDVAETIYFVASRPAHVDVQDLIVLATQQANSTSIDRSGR